MLFNSIEFALFLPIVFACYWVIGSGRIKVQNIFLLFSSYVFYGWWDYRFLGLIAFSSVVDYIVGLQLYNAKSHSRRKTLLAVSLIVNLGLLGFFKYYNFFLDNFIEAFRFFGQSLNTTSLSIILPVGISFYTFQTLSYTIDIYRKQMEPTRDFVGFLAYVSFFPQLVAGPIERASNLLPQFFQKRNFSFESGRDGARQILWGLFKKIVVADTCAIYANDIFNNYGEHGSATLLIGALCFTFQIYGDFSGYSDIAIGTAKLFGFNLMTNFRYPYFSRDIAEFWRRWHISLSSWFKDYLYIPLGGSKGSRNRTVFNIFAIFLVSGFWHGANWTFVAWGGLNALYLLPVFLLNRNRNNLESIDSFWPSLSDFLSILSTFFLTVLAWIFFRADSISMAIDYVATIFTFESGKVHGGDFLHLALMMLIWEWAMRRKKHGLDFSSSIPRWVRWGLYLIIIWLILYFFGEEQEFIYFQF